MYYYNSLFLLCNMAIENNDKLLYFIILNELHDDEFYDYGQYHYEFYFSEII